MADTRGGCLDEDFVGTGLIDGDIEDLEGLIYGGQCGGAHEWSPWWTVQSIKN
jgi:hypothetical protein